MDHKWAWLAGLWEGEGSFFTCKTKRGPSPRAVIAMCDKDVIERVRDILGPRKIFVCQKGAYKPYYRYTIDGVAALELMLNLFPYLGERRRAKVSDVLARWEH